jgi:hypothetical protein
VRRRAAEEWLQAQARSLIPIVRLELVDQRDDIALLRDLEQ